MTYAQKKSNKFEENLARFEWFKKEMKEYVDNGDFSEQQAAEMIEDMAEQLGL